MVSGADENQVIYFMWPKVPFCKTRNFRILETEGKINQYSRQNQIANRLECCFVDGMALKPDKNAENSVEAPSRLSDICSEIRRQD